MTQLTNPRARVLVAGQSHANASAQSLLSDLNLLTKPRLTMMVVLTTYIGFLLASKSPWAGETSWLTLTSTLIGVALSCMGASAFNQVYEQDTDALMRRTQNRPVSAGRMSTGVAMLIGVGLCTAGVGLLAVTTNALTAGLSAFTIFSYALVYTPMKRISSVSTIIGAVPGALPPVMGYTAVTGRVTVEAWVLFAILFLWQLPHFLAIAWLYRDEYAKAGMAFLPVIDPAGGSTFRQILLGCLALVPLGLVPTMFGMSGVVYFFGSLAVGIVFLGFGVALVAGRTRRHARALFWASLLYLPLVYGLMVLDYKGIG